MSGATATQGAIAGQCRTHAVTSRAERRADGGGVSRRGDDARERRRLRRARRRRSARQHQGQVGFAIGREGWIFLLRLL